MTKLKGLFLGSAAAILAVTGAQAADPPAEVWDYVRICDAYGTKYYYIPQTETCLRISGHMQWRATGVHYDEDVRARGFNPNLLATNSTNFDMLGRARVNIIAQEETEWGTLFGRVEVEFVAADNSTDMGTVRHAYLQIAGITAGHTDVLMNFGQGGGPNYLTISGDNGASRNQLIHYTVPFGNGFSIAAGFEESDVTDAGNVNIVRAGAGGAVAPGGDDVPDFVARLRVEQGWGSAQVSGIVRDVEAFEFGDGSEAEVGWAARAGLRINLDFLTNGGSIGGQFTYSSGANNYAADWAPDGVLNTTTNNLDLVDSWSAYGALEVGVTPTLSAGLWGGYTTVVDVEDALPFVGQRLTETWWNIGGTLTWSPLTNLVIGLDVSYENHEDRRRIAAAGPNQFADNDGSAWIAAIGMQRNF